MHSVSPQRNLPRTLSDLYSDDDRTRLLDAAPGLYGLVVLVGDPARFAEPSQLEAAMHRSHDANYLGPILLAREAEQDWEHRPLHLRQRLLRAVVGAVGTSPLSRHEQVMLSDVIERLQMWELFEQASSATRGDPRIASAMCQRILATDQRSPLLQLTAQVQSELRLRIGVSPDAT